MKRLLTLGTVLLFCIAATPQAVVTDPTSMAQRIAIFLEQMEEVVSQSLDIAENKENTGKLFQLSKESIEQLKNVSQYIKSSRQLVSITQAEVRIAEKVEEYSEVLKYMDILSPTEKLNAIRSIVMLGSGAMERVKSAIDLVKDGVGNAKMSDYERLQILSSIENEVLALESSMDDVYEQSISTASSDGILDELSNMYVKAITFDFD